MARLLLNLTTIVVGDAVGAPVHTVVLCANLESDYLQQQRGNRERKGPLLLL